MNHRWLIFPGILGLAVPLESAEPVGTEGPVGCLENPVRHQRLEITEPGVYENLLIDGEWVDRTLVKITADNVVLRNCEIRNGRGNAILVTGKNVTIESCLIHHLLAGTFTEQADAHGITGHPNGLLVKNCEIRHVSGDCIQFDPDRRPWTDVRIENCTLWTGPLPADAAGFRAGERPGENALDTKTPPEGKRSQLVIRRCRFHGWNQPGQISNLAALNLKENVAAEVTDCVFVDNEICLRLRGDTGTRRGAQVIVRNCDIHDSTVGIRMEDGIEDLVIESLGVGQGVGKAVHQDGRGPWPGFRNEGQRVAPPLPES